MAKLNGHGKPGHNSRGVLWMSRSYNCIDKNPEIDVFRTLYQRIHIKEDDLAAIAGLTTSTVSNMFGGKTRDPRHSTFAKLAGAMGKKYGLVDDHEINYAKEVPKAKEQRKLYRLTLARKRERGKTK
jgi:transcriptional regulator with XRE-family HTH domain